MGYPDDEIRAARISGSSRALSGVDPLPGELKYFPFAEGYYGVGTPLDYNGQWMPKNQIVLKFNKDLTDKL